MCNGNPHWVSPTTVQGGGSVIVWARILGDIIFGSFFVDGILNAIIM